MQIKQSCPQISSGVLPIETDECADIATATVVQVDDPGLNSRKEIKAVLISVTAFISFLEITVYPFVPVA